MKEAYPAFQKYLQMSPISSKKQASNKGKSFLMSVFFQLKFHLNEKIIEFPSKIGEFRVVKFLLCKLVFSFP